jgi:ABC-type multidrug transport system, permease component
MNSWLIAANLARRTIGTVKGILLFIALPAVIISSMVGLVTSTGGGSRATVGYADLDESEASRHIVRALEQTGRYKLVRYETDRETADMVAEREAATGFVIPAGFEADWLAGRAPELTLIRLMLDEKTVMLETDLGSIVRTMVQAAALAETAGGGAVRETAMAVLNQHLEGLVGGEKMDTGRNGSLDFLSIGFSLMFLMMLINQSVTVIVEDRQTQMMARVYAAPVRSFDIAAGNFIGSVFLGTFQVLAIAALIRGVFGYDFGVPAWMQIVIMECFILASLGMASAVAGFIRNTKQLAVINTLIMTPTCMIGGCFWPIEIMPAFMQKLANFVPQKWAIEAMTLGAAGETLSGIALPLGILLLFAAVLLGFGTAVLRPAK